MEKKPDQPEWLCYGPTYVAVTIYSRCVHFIVKSVQGVVHY